MLISHRVEGTALHVTLHHHLDITTRAAAALAIADLVHTHRPHHVTVQAPAGDPTPATISTVLRAHHTCKALGIPLELTGSTTAAQRLFAANAG
ncbi:hypothetical protein [Streptomyces anulatus]|uniref:hypothetical protein n=1 Tax=Streptomyces anulatus TaxID=1892 RepID=UPI00367AD46F